MKKRLVASLILGACVHAAACAAGEAALEPSRKAAIGSYTAFTAEVTAIDHETRMVTLKKPSGEENTFHAGDEVRNLAQVEVGDVLTVSYAERLALKIYPVETGAMGRTLGATTTEPLAIDLRSPWALAAYENGLFIAMAGSHQIWVLVDEM